MTEKATLLPVTDMLSRPDLKLMCEIIDHKLQYRGGHLRLLNLFEPDALWDVAQKYRDRVDAVSILSPDCFPTPKRSPDVTLRQTAYNIVHVSGTFDALGVMQQRNIALKALCATQQRGATIFAGCHPAIRNMLYNRGKTNMISPWAHEGSVVFYKK